jgi:hypothetical protein
VVRRLSIQPDSLALPGQSGGDEVTMREPVEEAVRRGAKPVIAG